MITTTPLDASEPPILIRTESVTTQIPTMTAMDGLTPMTGQTLIRVNGWILTETASVTMQMLTTTETESQTVMTPTHVTMTTMDGMILGRCLWY